MNDGILKKIDQHVNNIFIQEIDNECTVRGGFGAVPLLLYEFDGNLCESISDCDPKYNLQFIGNVKIINGLLECGDGDSDNFVFSRNNFDFGFESHSMEILVQINDLNKKRGGLISIDGIYDNNNNDDKSENKFDAIVYNDFYNDKKFILTSNDDVRSPTDYDKNQCVSETQNDEWIHLVATYDVVQKRAKLYRNGVIQLNFNPFEFITAKPDINGYRIMFCKRSFITSFDDIFDNSFIDVIFLLCNFEFDNIDLAKQINCFSPTEKFKPFSLISVNNFFDNLIGLIGLILSFDIILISLLPSIFINSFTLSNNKQR